MFTPGIDFLGRTLTRLLVYLVSSFIVLRILRDFLDLSVSPWVLAISSFIPYITRLKLKSLLEARRSAREAEARGAILPPHVEESGLEVYKLLDESVKNGYMLDAFSNLGQKYGFTYRFTIGGDERYFTTEPEHVKEILATQFNSFEKGSAMFDEMKSMLGTGVFNSDGDMWRFHRSITRPFFSKERISDFDIFDHHVEDALKQAKGRLAEGYPIDFQDLVSRFTFDSATEFLFKNDVHSQSAGLPYPATPSPFAKQNSETFVNHPSNAFVKAFIDGQDQVAARSRMGALWPLKEILGDAIVPLRKEVDKFVEPFVQEGLRRKHDKEIGAKASDDETLLDYLIQQTPDLQIIRDELVNLLVAARDTVSDMVDSVLSEVQTIVADCVALDVSLYMLTEHPDVLRRLREEILSAIGPNSRPSYSDIKEMKYLRAFLNEVLRLYPPVPINARASTKPVVVAPVSGTSSPIYLPAGKRFVYSVFLMHRRTDLWGPDALEFDPDRFLDGRLRKYLIKNPFIFTPFNAGPRICLAQQFAYNEASFFLVRLLQRFSSFSLATESQPRDSLPPKSWAGRPGPEGRDRIRLALHLTMYVKGGLWVRMGEADSK